MANLKLKKTILEVVENQLKANAPPCTKDTYEKLLDAGYSKADAKEKIGAVVLTEIYDILKEGHSFDEEKYKESLEEMSRQAIDYEDSYDMDTEWASWDDLVQQGYECFENQNATDGLCFWRDAWNIFCSIMEQEKDIHTVYDLMDVLDYEYVIDDWLQDYEMELGNAGKCEERIRYCQKVLEMFDWHGGDGSLFKCGIGESLFQEGKVTEAYEYYEKWLTWDSDNADAINSFCWFLSENGDVEKAYNSQEFNIRCIRYALEIFIQNHDERVEVFSIEDENIAIYIKDSEEIVFSYPVQYSNIPEILKDFIEENQHLWTGKKIFVIATMGLFSGNGTSMPARLLHKYGAQITGGLHLKMPDSIADERALKRPFDKNKELVKTAERKIEESA